MDVVPKDKYRFVWLSMFLFGISSLLPWNFFITANDYWMYKFRNTDQLNDTLTATNTTEDKTELQSSFTSYLAIASKVPFVIFLFVNAIISQKITPSKRIGVPLVVCILLFTITAVLVYVNTDHTQTAFLIGTLCSVAAINVVAAFLQGGGSGIAGALPSNYMTSNVFGQAAGGVFASLIQILTLVGDNTPQASALAFFVIALVTLMFTLVAFFGMIRMPFYKYYMSMQVGQNQLKNDETPLFKNTFQIAKQISYHAASSIVVFWVTLSVFPAVVVLIESVNKDSMPITGKFFLPVALFLVFNVFDIIGRLLAAFKPLPESRKGLLLILSVLRVVFVPLFMLCNAHPRTIPVVFNSDIIFVIFTILLASTNGYLYSIAMTNGPKMVEVQYQETAGSMLAFCLGAGLMLGSVTSLGFVKLLVI